MSVLTLAGETVFLVDAEGPPLASEADATDVLGAAMGAGGEWVAIPLARLSPAFLDLSTRVAGLMLQKFVNYRRRVAIVGCVAEAVAGSKALADFVRESNRGRHVWFVADLGELEARLAAAQ